MATRTAVITSHIAISHLPGQQKEQRDARTGGKDTPPVAFISGNGKADHRNVQRVVSQFVPAFVCQNTVSHSCLTSHSSAFPRRRQQGGGCVQGSGPALRTPSILAAGPRRPVGFPRWQRQNAQSLCLCQILLAQNLCLSFKKNGRILCGHKVKNLLG